LCDRVQRCGGNKERDQEGDRTRLARLGCGFYD
jgi:hypothetical protein